ncbi:MAG: hypothetical protein WD772_07940, partial [Pseudohongiellaceae bacterium]
MARPIPEKELEAIEDVVRRYPEGVTAQEIASAIPEGLPLRTLQYRLQRLVEEGRLVKEGERRWSRYRLPALAGQGAGASSAPEGENVIPLSEVSVATRNYLRQPPESRQPAGYNTDFLESYRPGVSFYLSQDERSHLA